MPVPAVLGRLDLVGDPGLRHVEMPGDAASGAPLLAPRAMFASERFDVAHRVAAALVVASAILVILFALHRNETGWLARVVRAPLMHPSAAIPERPGAGTRAVSAERSPAA